MRFTTMPCAIGSASANSSESPALAKPVALRVALALLALLVTFAAEARAVMINWTPVGDPGNAGDTAVMIQDGTTGYGSVLYSYNIDKYDVTNSQFVEFLNAKDATGTNTLGLYNGFMTSAFYGGINYSAGNANGSKYSVKSGAGNHPVNYVSWYDVIRFANWLNNGQGNGDTESGAYTLLHVGSPTPTPTPSNGDSITRNSGATVFLPNENEWYKAAYYNPGTASYFLFPTSSNAIPNNNGSPSVPTAAPNSANFGSNTGGLLTDVGAYTGSPSPYGTFDQGGNIYQWNETLIGGSSRGFRGGDFNESSGAMTSLNRGFGTGEVDHIGFRVASFVPEPSTGMLALIAFGTLWWWRKRLG